MSIKTFQLMITIISIIIINSKSENIFEINSQQLAINYQIQKGQYINNLTNLYFNSPQYIQIKSFTNQVSNNTKDLCEKLIFKPSQITNETYVFYNVKIDYQKYLKPIYQFAEIQNYKTVLDAIYFKGLFIILFQFGQFSYFTLSKNNQGDKIIINQSYFGTVNTQSKYISQGTFVIANDQCLYFSEKEAIRFFQNGTTKLLENYKPIGKQFQLAKQYNRDYVIIATAQKGIFHYKIGDNDLQFIGQSQILVIKQSKLNTQKLKLQIIDIQYDNKTQTMYFLDPQQGLFKTKFNNSFINQSQIQVQSTQIDFDLCQNLKLSGDQLYMTCPNLIIYDIKTGKYKNNLKRLQFIPNQIVKNESSGRLILFGDYNFGYFDQLDGQFSFGQIRTSLTKALIYEDRFLILNDFFVFVGRIVPQISKLHCYGDPEMVGLNKGILSIQGSCSTYNPTTIIAINQQGTNLNKSQNKSTEVQNISKKGMCQLKIPINITVLDNQSFILKAFEIIICLVIGWFGISISIYLCVRHIKVRKDYQILEQQATQVRTDLKSGKVQQMSQKQNSTVIHD